MLLSGLGRYHVTFGSIVVIHYGPYPQLCHNIKMAAIVGGLCTEWYRERWCLAMIMVIYCSKGESDGIKWKEQQERRLKLEVPKAESVSSLLSFQTGSDIIVVC